MSWSHPQIGTTDGDGQPSQFDLLLAAIPLALLAGLGSVLFFSVPQFVGVALGAGVAAGLIGYSVYAVAQLMSTAPDSESRHRRRMNRAD